MSKPVQFDFRISEMRISKQMDAAIEKFIVEQYRRDPTKKLMTRSEAIRALLRLALGECGCL